MQLDILRVAALGTGCQSQRFDNNRLSAAAQIATRRIRVLCIENYRRTQAPETRENVSRER